MENLDNLGPAFSVTSFKNELDVVFQNCEKENLLDSMWLFNNTPWANHDGKCVIYTLNEPTDVYYINLDGFDSKSAEIEKISFDNVKVTALHGFAGNSYTYVFKLGEVEVLVLGDNTPFAYSHEDVKNKYISNLERKIKGLNWQINNAKEAIENMKLK